MMYELTMSLTATMVSAIGVSGFTVFKIKCKMCIIENDQTLCTPTSKHYLHFQS